LRFSSIKIIGGGELNKKFSVFNCALTSSVKELIEKNGGTISSANTEEKKKIEVSEDKKKVVKSKKVKK
jgi:hypothetical protein